MAPPRSDRPLTVGVVSDTHGQLRAEAVAALRGVDHILHAGDIGAPEVLEALRALAPVTAVRGNVDVGPWAEALPEQVTLRLAGVGLHLRHDRKTLPGGAAPEGAAVVVSGHSHQPAIATHDGVLWLNPGSAGPRRFRLPVTLALLTLGDGPPRAALHPLLGSGLGNPSGVPGR